MCQLQYEQYRVAIHDPHRGTAIGISLDLDCICARSHNKPGPVRVAGVHSKRRIALSLSQRLRAINSKQQITNRIEVGSIQA